MANIITHFFDRIVMKYPFRNEKAGYFLMHDKDTGEVSAVPEAAILAKLNERIDGIVYPDGFTKTTPVTRVGNVVTIAAYDFEWRLKLNPYTNAAPFEITLDATESSELKRIDTLAATANGDIVYYKGVEDELILTPPRVSSDELRITDLTIFGDEVQEHTEPIVSEVYTLAEKEKLAILDPTADIDKPISTATDAALDLKADKLTTYTKTEVDSKVTSVYKIKPSVVNFESLPSVGNSTGDTRNILDTGMNYVWDGSVWDALGTTVDLSSKQDTLISGQNIKTINNISLVGAGENIAIPVRLKEVVVQNKSQLLGNLASDVIYLIDGSFSLLAGETIVVPAGGLNIMGYSFDASRIASYGIANHTIFTSAVGGSGNLIIHNIAFNATGTGAKVFDIVDSDGTHAVELVTVNFEGCKSIGKLRNYRQGTGITIGFYGCADGLMLSGTWTGFKLTNTNCFSFGATGTLFKKDVDTIFSNRLYLEINADFQTGSKLADFQASNFSLNELFQINASILKYNGTINDANATAVIPNIKANDVKCLWRSNVGLPDTALEKYVENAAVTGAYEINWLVDTYYLTLTGNTTFTESNLPASGKNTEELKIYLAGNFTPTFPAGWESNKVGTFKKGEINQITVKFIKTGVYFLKIDNSLTVYPAPDVSGVFPSSIRPGETSELTIYGSFFTPATIVSIASHTVNSVTFVNQGELLLSVTTSNAEGDFDLTISNGTTVVYLNKVLVYLGVVYLPTENDWVDTNGFLNLSQVGSAKIVTYNVNGKATWNRLLKSNLNYTIRFKHSQSSLGLYLDNVNQQKQFELIRASDNAVLYAFNISHASSTNSYARYIWDNNGFVGAKFYNSFSTNQQNWDSFVLDNYEFRKINNKMFLYLNNILAYTFSVDALFDLQLRIDVSTFDFIDIKYIELA